MKKHYENALIDGDDVAESSEFLNEQLITYIGNKRKLMPFLESGLMLALETLGKSEMAFADVFAGTGVVSRLARRWAHRLYINDFEAYSAYSNRVYHSNHSAVDWQAVDDARQNINAIASEVPRAGFITQLYAPADEANITPTDRVFYTRRNAMFIDTARQEIERLDPMIQPFVLAPLLQRASVHVNTSGVFKGFYKNQHGIGQFGGTGAHALQRICAPITIPLPVLSRFERKAQVEQKEAADFVKSLPPIDVAYFDPPYNQHPYGANYFMLNLILKYEKPTNISQISGIPQNWQRSNYNIRTQAPKALYEVMRQTPARILLISYNSEGFIKINEMTEMLKSIGKLTRFDQDYNTFKGCRNLSARAKYVKEWLFKVDKS